MRRLIGSIKEGSAFKISSTCFTSQMQQHYTKSCTAPQGCLMLRALFIDCGFMCILFKLLKIQTGKCVMQLSGDWSKCFPPAEQTTEQT